jgi:DNA-binding YbaB/EbfC family protein
MFPEGFDFGQLLASAQTMQAQLAQAQADLEAAEFTGSAGGGLVTATIRGNGELTAVVIDPKAVDPEDLESLGDLIVAAARDAHTQLAARAASAMPQLPDLGGLGL